MKKNILIVLILMVQQLAMAQNPICPIGTYIADPTSRDWPDGKCSFMVQPMMVSVTGALTNMTF
ncbi:MAG: hypothetical protein WCP85_26020 [Mariniphaga sp.]